MASVLIVDDHRDILELTAELVMSAGHRVRTAVNGEEGLQATKDTKSIHIDATGGKVTLTGHASSWQTIEDAANSAWAVPGVTEVVDQVKMQMTF